MGCSGSVLLLFTNYMSGPNFLIPCLKLELLAWGGLESVGQIEICQLYPFHAVILCRLSESPNEIAQPRNLYLSPPPHHNSSGNPA